MKYKIAICDDSDADRQYVLNMVDGWATSAGHVVHTDTFTSDQRAGSLAQTGCALVLGGLDSWYYGPFGYHSRPAETMGAWNGFSSQSHEESNDQREVDPITEAEIYSKFNDIAGDKTAIYISHRLSSCKFCDEIAVFHEGGVIQQGTHAELVADVTGKYHELWHAQAQYYTEKSV